MYTYALIHPRAADLGGVDPATVLGVEVTIPALAAQCGLGNIDPQHLGGDASQAAIEAALTWPLPPAGTTLLTVRADADSIGAMAVLELRAMGIPLEASARKKIALIAEADKEASGPWPGVKPTPVARDLISPTTGLMGMAADHEVSLAQRVYLLRSWLQGADLQPQAEGVIADASPFKAAQHAFWYYEQMAEAEAKAALAALETKVEDGIAIVVGSHRLAMSIGYRHAPVVVATNPDFRLQGGPAHMKHTIARWNSRTHPGMDWAGLTARLNQIDQAATKASGWGGSTSIIGSPQGVSSALDTAAVHAEVLRALHP